MIEAELEAAEKRRKRAAPQGPLISKKTEKKKPEDPRSGGPRRAQGASDSAVIARKAPSSQVQIRNDVDGERLEGLRFRFEKEVTAVWHRRPETTTGRRNVACELGICLILHGIPPEPSKGGRSQQRILGPKGAEGDSLGQVKRHPRVDGHPTGKPSSYETCGSAGMSW